MNIAGQVTLGGVIETAIPLTFTAGSPNTVATDASTGNCFSVTVTGNFTLSNPTGCNQSDDMQLIIWKIKQGGSGSNVMTLDTQFKLGSDITSATLSTAVNSIDYVAVRFRYVDGTSNDRFDVVALVRGLS